MERSKPFINKSGIEIDRGFLLKIIRVEKERITLLKEIPQLVLDITNEPVLDTEKIPWKNDGKDRAKDALAVLIEEIGILPMEVWSDLLVLQTKIMEIVDKTEMGRATTLWPMRYALSGKENSAGPHELAWLLGKPETIKRMREAVVQLG